MQFSFISTIRSSAIRIVVAGLTLCWCGAVCAQDSFELNDQTFNQWLFSASQGNFDPTSELTLNLEAVDRICGLNEEQKQRLSTAAHGDFARFGRQVDALKAKYVGKTYGQNEVGEIYQKIQPLAQVYQSGLLGDESLFAKMLTRTLTSEQSEKYQRADEDRRRTRYMSKVGLFVLTVERTCPLTEKQRTALIDMLVAETKAPKRFGQYDWYVIMYEASKVPDAKYESIVDEAQLRQIKVVLRQGQGMGHFLKQQKLIDE
jgi:hypothetical protein